MNGFLPYLLLTQKQVFGGATPSSKITPLGFLGMLLANSGASIIGKTTDDGSGHVRDVKIKYKKRPVGGQSGTTDDCTIQSKPIWDEAVIPSLSFRKHGIFLDYETIAKYEKEASQTVAIGKPPIPGGIVMEIYNALVDAGNGLLQDVNGDLLTSMAAAFGKNVTTGLNTAKTINFPLSTATNPLTQGLTSLISDVMQNEIRMGNFEIVGDGLINNVYLQHAFNTQNSKDQNYPAAIPQFYWDPMATSKFGANQFGIFEKNAAQLINVNKFDGFVGGDKLSTFLTTLSLPIVDSMGGTELKDFKFDLQVRHIDCPQEVEIGGVVTQVGRGWVLDLMANYALFNIPNDAYEATDRLSGNNGTLRYTATNA